MKNIKNKEYLDNCMQNLYNDVKKHYEFNQEPIRLVKVQKNSPGYVSAAILIFSTLNVGIAIALYLLIK